MIITQTPLRVSFLGGNTDFPEYFEKYGGRVVSTTIDKYIYCIVKERKFDDLIYVNYMKKEVVSNVDDLKHELVRESLKLLGITGGIEISFLSDIPTAGTGLGSSSAVTVGVLNALHNFLGEGVSAEQLAWEAVEIEIGRLRKPIGVQDQYAVALGGLREIVFEKSGVTSYKIPMDESVKEDFDNSLMLLYTGLTRKSEEILAGLDLEANRELLHKNKEFAKSGAETLEIGNLKTFARLLDEYWQAKKSLSNKISNQQIDKMYELAKEGGAVGGKVLGAGGGGFLLVMFPAHKRAKIRNKLKDYRELPFRISDVGSRVVLNI